MIFLDRKNTSEGNAFVGMPARFLGYYEGDTKAYLDLAAWRAAHGWDRTSVESGMQVAFDPATLRLTMSGARALPRTAPVKSIQGDLLGAPASAMRVAGPLANPAAKEDRIVDPRRKDGA